METRETFVRGAGVASVAVTMSTVLAATVLSPAFQWEANALSNLGVTSTAAGIESTVLLFNGGLIAGGLLGLVFAVALTAAGTAIADRATGVSFAIAVLCLELIGVFPQDTSLHTPVAVGFYLLVSVTLWLDALAALRHGWRRRLVVATTLGTANIVAWLLWGIVGPVTRPGVAIPELFGAVAFSTWVLWVSLGLLGGRWTTAD